MKDSPRAPALPGLGIRPGLLAAGAGRAGIRLTLVTAPGGSGKTTLLRAWRAAAGEARRSIWLALGADHRDPVIFVEEFVRAVRTQLEPAGTDPFGADLLRALPHLKRPAAETLWRYLRADLAGLRTPVLVFLDDYHRIARDSETDRLVGTMLRDDAWPGRFFVATRGAPPQAAARLLAAGEALEFGREALQMSPSQVRALLGHFEVSPDEDTVTQLFAETRGWVTGVLLAARGLARAPGTQRKRFLDGLAEQNDLFEYIASELLAGESPACIASAELLAVLGPCERETLANALPSDVPATAIQQAVDRGLLLEDGARVFVHNLWEVLLLRRLRERSSQAAWRELHERLAKLTESVDPKRATAILARGEVWEGLVAVLSRHGREWLNLGRDEFVTRHLGLLPDALRRGNAQLEYLEALTLRRRDVDLALDALMRVADRFRAEGQGERQASALFDAQIIAANRNRRDLMMSITRRVMSLRRLATDPRVRALSMLGLAFAALLSGRTRAADSILRRIRTRALLASERASASLLRLGLLRQQGRWSEALELIEAGIADEEIREHAPSLLIFELERAYVEGLRASDPSDAVERARRVSDDLAAFGLTLNEAMAREVVGLLESRRGHRDEAHSEFERASELAGSIGRSDLRAHMAALIAREHWQQGREEAAKREARRSLGLYADVPAKELRIGMSSARAVLPARVLAECGEVEHARHAAAAFAWLVDRLDVPLANFAAHVQHARIAELAEDPQGRMRHLRRAAALVDAANLHDAPPELEPALLRWAGQAADTCDIAWRPLGGADPAGLGGWSVGSLGGLRVAYAGDPIPEKAWRGATTRRLLLRLLCAGPGGVRRELLETEFWPDHEPASAHRNVRVALSRLRAALSSHDEGAIRIEGERVDVSPELRAGWDVDRLERGLRAHRVDTDLLALYRGPFAPEVYDPWAEPVRERVEDRVGSAALALIDQLAAGGDTSRGVGLATRLLEHRPADEALWARLIELRLAAGDRVGARRALNDARAVLERELGLDGASWLERVAEQLT